MKRSGKPFKSSKTKSRTWNSSGPSFSVEMEMSCTSTDGVARTDAPQPVRSSSATTRRRSACSFLFAGLLVVGLLATGAEEPLPTLVWAAAFLPLAVYFDVRSFRIPNALNAAAMFAAVLFHTALSGVSGAGFAFAGIGAGFAILLLPYVTGFLGAGDVKAAMALGAWFGAPVLASLLVWSALLGGVCGVAILLLHRGLWDALTRWAGSFVITFYTKRFTYLAPEAGSAATRVLPFACVLGCSVTAQFLWGTPWA